jgi:hypothetical protein
MTTLSHLGIGLNTTIRLIRDDKYKNTRINQKIIMISKIALGNMIIDL